MKLNPVPFLFLPGVALAGYLVGGESGLAWAVALWCAAVVMGTMTKLLRRWYEARRDATQPAETLTPSELTRPEA